MRPLVRFSVCRPAEVVAVCVLLPGSLTWTVELNGFDSQWRLTKLYSVIENGRGSR